MPRKSHFEQFEPHTKLKHFLLESYVKQWATILLAKLKAPGRRGPRLWFVDAFAGSGRDSVGSPGSPVIASKIAQAINAQHFGTPLGADEGMRVVAIEADATRYETLRQNLAEFSGIAVVRAGTLDAILPKLTAYAGHDAILFFLDPFGVDGLDAAILPQILAGPRTEVLLLFSDEGAVRLAGKAGATVPTRDELLARKSRGPSMFGEEFDAALETADRLAVEKVISGHQSNPRAEEILNKAFGGSNWKMVIENTPPENRRARFVALYEEVLRQAGASHVLNFEIATEQGRHKYTLIHASKHKRAFAAMKEAMDRARRSRPSATPGSLFSVEGLGDDTPLIESDHDIQAAADQVVRNFSGETVRWTGQRYSDNSIVRFALDETPLWKHEIPLLRAELNRRGLVLHSQNGKPATPLSFEIP